MSFLTPPPQKKKYYIKVVLFYAEITFQKKKRSYNETGIFAKCRRMNYEFEGYKLHLDVGLNFLQMHFFHPFLLQPPPPRSKKKYPHNLENFTTKNLPSIEETFHKFSVHVFTSRGVWKWGSKLGWGDGGKENEIWRRTGVSTPSSLFHPMNHNLRTCLC